MISDLSTPFFFPPSSYTHSPRFAPPAKESRVAMLYAKYLGMNGRYFDVKVMGVNTIVTKGKVKPAKPKRGPQVREAR